MMGKYHKALKLFYVNIPFSKKVAYNYPVAQRFNVSYFWEFGIVAKSSVTLRDD